MNIVQGPVPPAQGSTGAPPEHFVQVELDRARLAFLRACELDVSVRKPGNVSRMSPGHGMDADLFLAAAQAAAGPLFARGTPVGQRIEQAMQASWQAVGCNANLGILLLCAPIALAVERLAVEGRQADEPLRLRTSIDGVLATLDLADSQAAFRAIVQANPAGLGQAPREDVRSPPQLDLRGSMSLAAHRDRIALLYRDGFGALFDRLARSSSPSAVLGLYLALLSDAPDSHIVRKHGEAVAHIVMTAAQGWRARRACGEDIAGHADFIAWDGTLKSRGINPGTTADLVVATLFISGLLAGEAGAGAWHGT